MRHLQSRRKPTTDLNARAANRTSIYMRKGDFAFGFRSETSVHLVVGAVIVLAVWRMLPAVLALLMGSQPPTSGQASEAIPHSSEADLSLLSSTSVYRS